MTAATGTSTAPGPAADVNVRPTSNVQDSLLPVVILARWWTRPLPGDIRSLEDLASEERALATAGCYEPLAPAGASSPSAAPPPGAAAAELLAEYERLFVGPGPVPCPPYESFWRTDVPVDIRRSLMGPCTAELRDLYARLGLGVAPETGELSDHVAVELEALAVALATDGAGDVAEALFDDHLRVFLPRLCRAVEGETTLPYYRDLAAATMRWLSSRRSA